MDGEQSGIKEWLMLLTNPTINGCSKCRERHVNHPTLKEMGQYTGDNIQLDGL